VGTTQKTLSRIMDFVASASLPIGGAIAELGAQQLHCPHDDLLDFLRFFEARTGDATLSQIAKEEIDERCSGGYLGNTLKAVKFTYMALDLFRGVDTNLFDLNLHFVPRELRGRFDLVTNYGTSEHVINQMLAMKSLHDLAKTGGIIHHDLPMCGYHLHGYFNYNPGLFHDLATANNYEILFQKFSPGDHKSVPDFMRRNGYQERVWQDCGIEVAFRKTDDLPFKLPLDTVGSVTFTDEVWIAGIAGEEIAIAPNMPADAEVLLARLPFRTLHEAYVSKLQRGISDRVRRVFARRTARIQRW
jgi:hypothetical protein